MNPTYLASLIDNALTEDLGDAGDLTSLYFIPETDTTRVALVARQPCTLSGVEVAAQVFQTLDPSLAVDLNLPSGTRLTSSFTQPILTISGKTRSILSAERTALNFAQRLSGVATLTAAFVSAVAGTRAAILDTRKTTPGWRLLEKAAVRHGGGQNHRLGLYDRVMLKDNHLAAEDSLDALQKGIDALKNEHPEVEIEIEADHLSQVERFLHLRHLDYILLDNMSLDHLRQAVQLCAPTSLRLEASGGITLETVRSVAETGVDFISVGALTHSAPAVDLALDTLS